MSDSGIQIDCQALQANAALQKHAVSASVFIKGCLRGAGGGHRTHCGVLIGEHNPKYLEFVAVSDIRPTNQKRIFTGDLDKDGRRKPTSPRKGLNYHYGNDAETKIKVFADYKEMLEKVPEIAELDLNPIFALPPGQGCQIVDARLRVEPARGPRAMPPAMPPSKPGERDKRAS